MTKLAVGLVAALALVAGCGDSSPRNAVGPAAADRRAAPGRMAAPVAPPRVAGRAAAGQVGTGGNGQVGGAGASVGGAGGGGGAASFVVSGSVTGLAGSGLTLQDGAGHQLVDCRRRQRGAFAFTSATARREPAWRSPSRTSPPRRRRPAPSPAAPRPACRPTSPASRSSARPQLHRRRHGHRPDRHRAGPARQPRRRPGGERQRRVHLRDAGRQRRDLHGLRQDAADRPGADLPGVGRLGHRRRRNVTSVSINCAINTYTVGGTVSGLAGTGLVLQNKRGDDLSVTGQRLVRLPDAGRRAAPPSRSRSRRSLRRPMQVCSVSQGSGTVASQPTSPPSSSSARPTATRSAGRSPASPGRAWCCRTTWATTSRSSADGHLHLRDPGRRRRRLQRLGADAAVVAQPDLHGDERQRHDRRGGGHQRERRLRHQPLHRRRHGRRADGTGLTLQTNGGDDLAISANGAFQFATPSPAAARFAVTIAAQPSSPGADLHGVGRDRHRRRRGGHLGDRQLRHRPVHGRRQRHQPGGQRPHAVAERRRPTLVGRQQRDRSRSRARSRAAWPTPCHDRQPADRPVADLQVTGGTGTAVASRTSPRSRSTAPPTATPSAAPSAASPGWG